jgi:hypothetical protein
VSSRKICFQTLRAVGGKVQPSKENRKDYPHSKNWLDSNKALWTYLSELLRQLEPDMYRTATGFGYLLQLKGQHRNFAEAWSGMAINQKMTPEARSDWHYDWLDSEQVFNCLVPFGQFTGADLLLWDLETRVQISRGEVFFFYGRVLGHKVTPILHGNRSVLDLLTHKSNFDDKHRNFSITKKWKTDRKAKAKKPRNQKKKAYRLIDQQKKAQKQGKLQNHIQQAKEASKEQEKDEDVEDDRKEDGEEEDDDSELEDLGARPMSESFFHKQAWKQHQGERL